MPHGANKKKLNTPTIESLLDEWMDSFDDPDKPIMLIPDEMIDFVSPRQVVIEIRKNTYLGRIFLRSLENALLRPR